MRFDIRRCEFWETSAGISQANAPSISPEQRGSRSLLNVVTCSLPDAPSISRQQVTPKRRYMFTALLEVTSLNSRTSEQHSKHSWYMWWLIGIEIYDNKQIIIALTLRHPLCFRVTGSVKSVNTITIIISNSNGRHQARYSLHTRQDMLFHFLNTDIYFLQLQN